ncbi:2-oxo acid dehydrogenase subunit E2 [Actinokineospora xionganensis]|uniref:2-oxo acid dehydrogenase subunit E2 n=1 Tax=Actinokineospora xionganensis TaxID=2684470 RepID=A0ABR7KZQ6_9PSEU|nr:2-oxo acid dehydrogenase subunit E2 [Actinokineospora xionganensis]MBC6445915.1 2-oxo acid dehydrogenase subunit E2 [Actinokineospora xionganensis]
MTERVRGWRKLAGSSWRPPDDPQFYGELEIDASAMLSYVEYIREHTGTRLTMTHLVGRAVAYGLAEVPEMCARLAFGRTHPRESIDVFFIVATDGGRELTGVKISDADTKPAVRIADELNQRVEQITRGEDPAFGRSKRMLAVLPPMVLRRVLNLAAWLTSDLNLDLSPLGMPRQAFGAAMVTSVGMWGVRIAYSPLARYYRVPLLVLVGAVESRPMVVDGEVRARPVLTLTATVDHRYADGSHTARMADAVRRYCSNPSAFEPS